MSAPTYEIRTIADFAKVPPKRLRACLRDFRVAVEMGRAMHELVAAAGEALGTPGIITTPSVFRWIDDGKKTATLKVGVKPEAAP